MVIKKSIVIYLHNNFKGNISRAISITRTVFRLNTNQSHAYEDYITKKKQLIK